VAEREKAVAEREKARAEAQATRRRLRQTRLLAAGLAVVLLIAGVFGLEARKQGFLSEAAATLDENPAESLRNAVKAYRTIPDADTREAVLAAASVPRDHVIAGSPGEPRVAGMVVTPDQRHVVTYDVHGGIGVIDDNGRLTKSAKASHLAGVFAAATSPSASQVALATDQGAAAVIDVGTGRQVDLATDRSPISAFWWIESSPDDLVLVVSSSGRVATYSATTGREVARVPNPVYWARPTAEGQIMTSDHDSRLRIWNARTAQKVAESSPLAGQTTYLQPYAHEAVGVTEDNNLIIWDWRASPEPRQYPLKISKAFVLMTMNEGTNTIAVAADKAVRIYNLEDGSLRRTLPKQPNWLTDVELDSSGQWIATAGGGERVLVWSAQGTGPLSGAAYGFIAPGGVKRVSYLHEGKAMVILGLDGTVRFCPLPQIRRFDLHDWALGVDVSADGRWLAAASADGTVSIVDLAAASNVPVATVPVGGAVETVRFDPTDPHRIFTLTWFGKQPMGWRWDSGRRAERISGLGTPPALSGSLSSLTISRDGKRVAAGDYRGNIYRWDAHTGKLTGSRVLKGSGQVFDIAFDPSGQMIATASHDGILLTRLDASERPKQLSFPDATSVAFDQRGEHIVSTAEDRGTLRVWTRDGQLVHDLVTRAGTVGRPSFSDDGRLVAVGTGEGLIEVWDVHSGRMVMRVRRHSDMVNEVLFLPGGQSRLVSASEDSTVVVSTCEACVNPDAVVEDAQRWVDGPN
ncbi:MAG: WD40 repeat domain-containing protein, partial [Pseudonocardiaceae bacterium]